MEFTFQQGGRKKSYTEGKKYQGKRENREGDQGCYDRMVAILSHQEKPS